MKATVSDEMKKVLIRQHYGLAGDHSAVKLCTWLKKSLHDEGVCYKQKFYGIRSHLCLQNTPVLNWCSHNCPFCWRVGDFDLPDKDLEWEKPSEIIDKMIDAQRKLLTGFKGDGKTNLEKWESAQNPKHAAISLTGEPTLYPYISELVKEFHNRGITTFIVTNGTYPEVLENMNPLPTQLYVTLVAPDEDTYWKATRSRLKDGWQRLLRTVTEVFPKLKTRKVIRLTLVKGLNMHSPEKYADIISKSGTHFVEVKAYMAVGNSTQRLPYDSMPTHDEIRNFSEELAKHLGWKIIDEQEASRVVLLAKEDYDWRKNVNEAPF